MYKDEDWTGHVGPGWEPIVKKLVDMCKEKDIEIYQIKEKFGGLRFYTEFSTDPEFNIASTQAEEEALKTCEVCGKPGKLRNTRWLKTLCEEHYEERMGK